MGHRGWCSRKDNSNQPGKDHDKRHHHLEVRSDDRRELRGTEVLGGDGALDDQEIRCPVTE
jgi:hypothetical protein